MTSHERGCVITIFGASGDLTRRKLVPALCNLAAAKLLPERFAVVGVASRPMTTDAFREHLEAVVRSGGAAAIEPRCWQWVKDRIYYVQGDCADPATYEVLRRGIEQVEARIDGAAGRLFYLAVAPTLFPEIVRGLSAAGLALHDEDRWSRVVVEKPFGRDLQSARALNRELLRHLREEQIYRIDHYLGKETVQNLLVFRFANTFPEPLWNRHYIDHLQITATETVGVEHRGRYYETSGAMRDMIPNHLLQLLSLTAMEPPISFDANAVRDKQAEVLHAVQPPTVNGASNGFVLGQYGAALGSGDTCVGYRDEPNVDPNSATETFAALKLTIDNWRWAGVPFFLRTGKRLAKRVTEIAIQFRRPPVGLFRNGDVGDLHGNRLVLHIQPDEGISLQFGAKRPGTVTSIGNVNMDFDYARDFGQRQETGYERLIHDCMLGDATLFQRADMIEAGWSIVDPLLCVDASHPARAFPNYPAGSWGPAEADALLAREGRQWGHRV